MERVSVSSSTSQNPAPLHIYKECRSLVLSFQSTACERSLPNSSRAPARIRATPCDGYNYRENATRFSTSSSRVSIAMGSAHECAHPPGHRWWSHMFGLRRDQLGLSYEVFDSIGLLLFLLVHLVVCYLTYSEFLAARRCRHGECLRL